MRRSGRKSNTSGGQPKALEGSRNAGTNATSIETGKCHDGALEGAGNAAGVARLDLTGEQHVGARKAQERGDGREPPEEGQ